MQITPLQFTPVGFGNAVCANRVVAIARPDSAAGRRTAKRARENNAYIDMTFGRSLKCLLLLDDGTVAGCGITTRTLIARMDTGSAHQPEDDAGNNTDEPKEEDIT